MERACDSCQGLYEAIRQTSRFCSPRCRQRAQRGHVVPLAARTPEPEFYVPAALYAATLAELTAAGRESSALGVAALSVASRVDSGQDSGSAVASLVREWRTTLAAATDGVKTGSHVDELREKRQARRSG